MIFLRVVLVLFLSVDILWALGDGCNPWKDLMIRDDSLPNLRPLNALWHSQSSIMGCCKACVIHDTCSAIFFSPADGSCLGFVTSTPEDDVLVAAPGFLLMRLDKACPVGQGYLHSPSLGLCLKLHKNRKKWNGSKRACEKNGEHLAMLKTVEETIFVQDYMSRIQGSATFIGAFKLDDVFFWLDGTRVEEQWFSSTPGGRTPHDHLFVKGGRWGIGSADIGRWYLCQRNVPSA